MSDPNEIKKQTTVNSEDVTPGEASKDLEEITDKDLGKVTGGGSKPIVMYADCL